MVMLPCRKTRLCLCDSGRALVVRATKSKNIREIKNKFSKYYKIFSPNGAMVGLEITGGITLNEDRLPIRIY